MTSSRRMVRVWTPPVRTAPVHKSLSLSALHIHSRDFHRSPSKVRLSTTRSEGWMFSRATVAACAAVLLGTVTELAAQNWSGIYVGGTIGGGLVSKHADEIVTFDTNLDGSFGDTVRTV